MIPIPCSYGRPHRFLDRTAHSVRPLEGARNRHGLYGDPAVPLITLDENSTDLQPTATQDHPNIGCSERAACRAACHSERHVTHHPQQQFFSHPFQERMTPTGNQILSWSDASISSTSNIRGVLTPSGRCGTVVSSAIFVRSWESNSDRVRQVRCDRGLPSCLSLTVATTSV